MGTMALGWKLLLLICVASLTLAGCADNKSARAGNPVIPGSTADPYAIPPVIDEAYINKVLAAIEEVRIQVLRDVVATRTLSDLNKARLQAI